MVLACSGPEKNSNTCILVLWLVLVDSKERLWPSLAKARCMQAPAAVSNWACPGPPQPPPAQRLILLLFQPPLLPHAQPHHDHDHIMLSTLPTPWSCPSKNLFSSLVLLLRPRDRNSKLPKKVHIYYPSGPQICHTCHTQICHTRIILRGPNLLGPIPLPRSPCIGFLIFQSRSYHIYTQTLIKLTSKYSPFKVNILWSHSCVA